MLRIFSSGIRSIPYLESFLDAFVGNELRAGSSPVYEAVAGWGLRRSAHRAMHYARQHGLTYLALEDGFLRSLSPGKGEAPLSMVIDDVGIYYDATRASLLEKLIAQPLSPKEISRSQGLILRWREGRVSKYNHQRDGRLPESINKNTKASAPPVHGGYVLVVDQVRGDASIKYGQADETSFQRMIEAALFENPTRTIVVKSHPEVISGNKRGHLDLEALSSQPRVMVLTDDLHPATLLEQAEAVYVVTSQMGFEGLIWGKTVRTFGMPFYAGWGLTQDEQPAPERRGTATLEQLVHAALIAYPRYINPETGKACEVEEVLEHLALQRRMRGRFPQQIHAQGFSWLKGRHLRRFFAGSLVRFCRRNESLPDGESVALWGSDSISNTADRNGNLIRVEDGFLRSVGLGAELVRPLSWVMDQRGIYYDASRPSDLEHLLQTGKFDAALCARASRLRQRIVSQGLSKYNVGSQKETEGTTYQNAQAVGRRVILVPGQVESDASIRFGAASIRTNMDLLRAVRRANSSAYIIYKPHPDVVNKLRAAGVDEDQACTLCDELVDNVSLHALLKRVDEVHVLTSLTGFESLLRGKPVITYGQPFYAGWGLTVDRALSDEVAQRRCRKLTLDELVAGVLLCYPTYVSRKTGRFTTAERVLDELLEWRESAGRGRAAWRTLLRWLLSVRGAVK